jgi:hypothetical protein
LWTEALGLISNWCKPASINGKKHSFLEEKLTFYGLTSAEVMMH